MDRAALLAMLAGLGWGIGELCTKSVLHSKQIGPITALSIRATVALPAVWLACVVVQRLKAEPTGVPPLSAANWAKLLLGSGLVSGAVAALFFFWALHLGELSRVKPIAFTVAPAAAVLLGWLVLGEPMTWRKGIGAAMILVGVVVISSGGTATTRG